MPSVVTGLSQNGNITALNAALEAAGLSIDPIQVIAPDDSTPSMARGLAGSEILTSDPGTGVPGINSGPHFQRFFRNESLSDRLGDFEIPDSEIENFVEALERGKFLVAYFAHPADAERIAEIFRGNGLLNVREYGGSPA